MPVKNPHTIIGVHITDRVKHVPSVQEVLTRYGCSIKTRLGLHETSDNYCSPNGLLLIEFTGDQKEADDFMSALEATEGIEAQKMVFTHG